MGRHSILRRQAVWVAMLVSLLISFPSSDADARRYASIVIDANSGQILHSENPDRKAFPASLTKIMTLYMVFDALETGRLSMKQQLTVSKRASRMPPSKLGLRAGSRISVKNAIMALVTKSANDVAVVIAEALGGTESNFAAMMTQKARALGMTRTTFRNASGLPNKGQLSTARDMAKLARIMMERFPRQYRLFASKSFKYKGRTYRNHNNLLRHYKGTDGIKTGYTHASGYNLVASTVRNGRRLIGVVFGGRTSRTRDRHMVKLLNRSFALAGQIIVKPLASAPPRKPWVDGPGSTTQLAEAVPATIPDQTGIKPTPSRSLSMAALQVAPSTPEAQAPAANETAAPAPAEPDGAPRYAAIPKRPDYHSAQGSPKSKVPVAPAYASIPQRPDYDTAQGSTDSPVPTPPSYGAIPKRPDGTATEAQNEAKETPTSDSSLGSPALKILSDAPSQAEPAPAPDSSAQDLELKLLAEAIDDMKLRGAWGIQVGAFRQLAPAHLAVEKATAYAPEYLTRTKVGIVQVEGDKGEIFRARLIGMNEIGARQACRKLKRHQMPCFVVPPTPTQSGG